MGMATIISIAGNPVASRPDADSVVILGADRNYYSLTGAGRLVWDVLSEGPATLSRLVEEVVGAFDVNGEQAAADLDELVESLSRAKLVETAKE